MACPIMSGRVYSRAAGGRDRLGQEAEARYHRRVALVAMPAFQRVCE